jgi:bifunctional non-homologous end joining protein LigD
VSETRRRYLVSYGFARGRVGAPLAAPQPLAVDRMLLTEPPPRGSRFGSPLVLSRVHWVQPEMVVEVSYFEWTPDGLLRHVVYLGEHQDKLATEVRRNRPHAGET